MSSRAQLEDLAPSPPAGELRARVVALLRHPKRRVMLASGFGQVCSFACAPILSRLYSPADFGAFVTFSTLFNLLNITLSLRYEQALYYAGRARDAARVVSLAANLAVVSALLFAGAALAGYGLRGMLTVGGLSALAALSALGSVLTRIASLLIVRWKNLRALAFLSFARPSSVAFMQLLGGLCGAGELALAVSHALANLLVCGLTFLRVKALRRFVHRSSRGEIWESMRAHRAFALYNLPQNLVFVVSDAIVPLLAAQRYGAEFGGLYWFAARMTNAPMQVFVESVRVVVSDELVRTVRAGKAPAHWALRKASMLAAPFLCAAALLAVGGPTLFEAVFGAVWRDAGGVAALLFVYAALNAAGVPMVAALPLTGLQRGHLLAELAVLAGKACILVGPWEFGFLGAVGASVAVAAVGYALFYTLVCRNLRRLARSGTS